MDWRPYLLDYDFCDFRAGARVLDVGCGAGAQVRELARRGCLAIGVDVRPGAAILLAAAEALPFRDASFDGVVCKVTLPYTDERLALAEIKRVLREDGVARIAAHGFGYYGRMLLLGAGRERVYALRTIWNTWLYRLTGRRLIGDSLYQTPRRIGAERVSRFLGLPVFIYATMRR